jgi:hypothetical protein
VTNGMGKNKIFCVTRSRFQQHLLAKFWLVVGSSHFQEFVDQDVIPPSFTCSCDGSTIFNLCGHYICPILDVHGEGTW